MCDCNRIFFLVKLCSVFTDSYAVNKGAAARAKGVETYDNHSDGDAQQYEPDQHEIQNLDDTRRADADVNPVFYTCGVLMCCSIPTVLLWSNWFSNWFRGRTFECHVPFKSCEAAYLCAAPQNHRIVWAVLECLSTLCAVVLLVLQAWVLPRAEKHNERLGNESQF